MNNIFDFMIKLTKNRHFEYFFKSF